MACNSSSYACEDIFVFCGVILVEFPVVVRCYSSTEANGELVLIFISRLELISSQKISNRGLEISIATWEQDCNLQRLAPFRRNNCRWARWSRNKGLHTDHQIIKGPSFHNVAPPHIPFHRIGDVLYAKTSLRLYLRAPSYALFGRWFIISLLLYALLSVTWWFITIIKYNKIAIFLGTCDNQCQTFLQLNDQLI